MSIESLYNKYRPDALDKVRGNVSTVAALKSKIDTGKIIHTALFCGQKGCGKTTLARIAAKEFGCCEIDINEINCADSNGIDGVRKIRILMRNRPMEGKMRAWIFDECHRLTKDAQSALLKMLEEPPDHVCFFLCTTDPQSLLPTIRSRCIDLQVEPLTEKEMTRLLKGICIKERKKIPSEVISQIATDSLGCPRDGISILEKIIDLNPKDMETAAKKTAEQQNAIIDLCRSLFKKRPWKEITFIINNLNDNPETIRRSVCGYCDSILAKSDEAWAWLIIDVFDKTKFWDAKYQIRKAAYEALEEIKGE